MIAEHDAILLAYHGSLTVGPTVWDAYLRLESLEHSANILYKVEQLGGPKAVIPPDQVEKLLAQREKLGLSRPGDALRFYESCDVVPGGLAESDLQERVRAVVQEVLQEILG